MPAATVTTQNIGCLSIMTPSEDEQNQKSNFFIILMLYILQSL